MEKFNYVVALVAVITGLGLSDVTVSLHRLLKRRSQIEWDWIPVVFAVYLSLVLMRLWYQLWGVHAKPGVTELPFVTLQVVQTLVLVLVASAVLPDQEDLAEEGFSLRRYYAHHSRYIWTMYLLFVVIWFMTGVYFRLSRGWFVDRLAYDVLYSVYFLIPTALTVLALFSRRTWQGAILCLLLVHEIAIPSNFFGLLPMMMAALR